VLEIRVTYGHLLETLSRVEARPSGFYAIVFSTTATTPEQQLNSFIQGWWQELDTLMASADSACFAVADSLDVRTRQDVYLVAREMGIPFEALPAIAFFVEPEDLREVMYVGLGDFLKNPDDYRDRLWELFRAIAGAMARATDASTSPSRNRLLARRQATTAGERRLVALREEWQRGLGGQHDDVLGRVVATSGQLAETASNGRTILETLSGAARTIGLLV